MDLNTAINTIFLLFGIIATFAQGYSFRRRYPLGVLISGFIMILQMPIGIYIKGIDAYNNSILSASISDWSIATIFVAFWWILGYVVGGIIPHNKEPEYPYPITYRAYKQNK